MVRLIACAKCGATRAFSLTSWCQKCGFAGFKQLQSIEDHPAWPVYQSRRANWQEMLRQAKIAHREMALVQKELAQACVAMGLESSAPPVEPILDNVSDDDAAGIMLAENGELRRKLQETTSERDSLRTTTHDLGVAVKKALGQP